MAAGKTRISHGNDHWQSKNRIHTYAVFGGNIVRELGFWAIPGLWHWYFDDFWEKVAHDFRLRRFVPEVRTEHKHYIAEKAEKDDTYIAGESRNQQDCQIYKNFMIDRYPELKERMKEKFKDYGA